jgi:hemerythrin
MNGKGAEIVQLAHAQMRLPTHLRTEHWYNDWQHAVFIITFDHLMKALEQGHAPVAERLIDKLTVYLFVHFLCEEEGMAFSQQQGVLLADKIHAHQATHLRFLDYWHTAIQRPFKTGELDGRRLARKIHDFYDKVLAHIDADDQSTYGTKIARPVGHDINEVAHIAQSGLPLSPNSAGALAVVGACCGGTHGLLRADGLPIKAIEPLRSLRLAPATFGAEDSVRSRVLRLGSGLALPAFRLAA